MALFKRILHPSDFSSASAPAFKQAVELAAAHRARTAADRDDPCRLPRDTDSRGPSPRTPRTGPETGGPAGNQSQAGGRPRVESSPRFRSRARANRPAREEPALTPDRHGDARPHRLRKDRDRQRRRAGRDDGALSGRHRSRVVVRRSSALSFDGAWAVSASRLGSDRPSRDGASGR